MKVGRVAEADEALAAAVARLVPQRVNLVRRLTRFESFARHYATTGRCSQNAPFELRRANGTLESGSRRSREATGPLTPAARITFGTLDRT
jgi:hypothetical protein